MASYKTWSESTLLVALVGGNEALEPEGTPGFVDLFLVPFGGGAVDLPGSVPVLG